VKARKRAKLKKNDQVVLIAGRDKGKRAVCWPSLQLGKVKIEGAGMIKRHQKPAAIAAAASSTRSPGSIFPMSRLSIRSPAKFARRLQNRRRRIKIQSGHRERALDQKID
jgi:large subunit ribosomal protein L24